jgi:hypothetical protein
MGEGHSIQKELCETRQPATTHDIGKQERHGNYEELCEQLALR